MASYQDIRNLKQQLSDLWEDFFVVYPAEDQRELDRYVERLKRSYPTEQGGELLARIKKFSTPLFSKAGEEGREPLDDIVDAVERQGSKSRRFTVVHSPRIVCRALPQTNAPMVCTRRLGEVLEALEVKDGWIRCREGARDAWALIDGTLLGFGPLLEELPRSAAPPPGGAPRKKAADLSFPRQYKVTGKKGALLRASADMDSARVKPNLEYGTECTVSEERVLPDGTTRLHVTSPIAGWTSDRVMSVA